MKYNSALRLVPIVSPPQSSTSFERRLTPEQLEALRRCANRISLRFDAHEIVDALVAGGYVQKGVAGVVTATAQGREYLREPPKLNCK